MLEAQAVIAATIDLMKLRPEEDCSLLIPVLQQHGHISTNKYREQERLMYIAATDKTKQNSTANWQLQMPSLKDECQAYVMVQASFIRKQLHPIVEAKRPKLL